MGVARPYIVGLTGASGVVYGVRLIRALGECGYPVAVVISETAQLVLREEMGIILKSATRLDGLERHLGPALDTGITVYSPKDFTAPIASGSYPTSGMVIMPCSMGTVGAIASGLSLNLIQRAADCVLKENRRLVIVPRETPLHAGHLENMLKLVRMGARMVPAMPGFYSGEKSIEDLVDFMVGKVLDQLEIPNACYPRWIGSNADLLKK